MAKTLLHRLFGIGGIPKRELPALQREGIVLFDEGISGSVSFENFRAPGRRYGRKWSRFTGSVVLTGKRFVAFTFYPYFNPIIDVQLDDERMNELHFTLRGGETLCIRFDPSAFHEDRSGSIECRFSTPKARLFLEHLGRTAA